MSSAIAIILLLQFFPATNLNVRLTVAGTHDPVAFANVRIEKLGITVFQATARDGRAEIPSLTSGSYTIIVDAPGYDTAYSDITMPGDSFLFIGLHPKDPMPIRPQGANTKGSATWWSRFFHRK
jgi:Carboxypeptidase regulatory-like domain